MLMQRLWPILWGTLIGVSFTTHPTYAKNSNLAPVKVKHVRKLKKYRDCRAQALQSLQKGSISKEKFASELDTCRENFPAADLYAACKKTKLRAIQAKGEEDATQDCQKLVDTIEYHPSDPLPLALVESQLFFAGIGLNQAQPIASLHPPGFNCEQLSAAAKNPVSLQHVLFGNHPRFFGNLLTLSGANLRRLFPGAVKDPQGVDLPGYGHLFGDPGKPSATVFFPSASCTFEGPLGGPVAGLAAHYLIDVPGGMATPYFGIIYFKDHPHTPETAEVVRLLAQILGPGFKTVPKNPAVTFIAAADLTERDREKDPKNLCQNPRLHALVGVVHGTATKPEKPSYALIANVKNLCDFGDHVTQLRLP